MTQENESSVRKTEAQASEARESQAQQPQEKKSEERTFTQADVSKIAANEKREGRQSVLRELGIDDLDELKSIVEDYRAAQEMTQTELEKYQKQVEALTPRAEKAERYESALTNILEREREGLPEYIIQLLDRMDPAEQLEYIAEHRDLLKPEGRASLGRGSSPGEESREVSPEAFRRMSYEERVALYKKNPELYRELSAAT
ncbi:MAG: hypothetical protein K6T51_01315 [Rubrobacteraceae bacterium]|nr:hypothetical protein [Rubrobacteraceae bacterium]